MELTDAVRALENEGHTVCAVQTASRKGVAGDQKRVVRHRVMPNGSIELVYSVFKTDYSYLE